MLEDEPGMSAQTPSMNPSSLLAAAVETTVNAWLRQDPEILAQFAALEGHVIALHIEGLALDLYFMPAASGIQVLGRYEGEPDTRISGTPAALAKLTLGAGEDSLFAGDVKIEGDTALGQQFQQLLGAVEVDWEELLSRATGDVVAHQAGEAARSAQRALRRAATTLQQDLTEYLQEELRLLPTPVEISNFLDDVDRLRSDIDRLEAHVKRLHERVPSA